MDLNISKAKTYYNTLSLQNGEINLQINFYEIIDETKLFHLWPSTKLFANYVLNFSVLFKRKTILEIGSGVGILGIVSMLSDKEIKYHFSDLEDIELKNLVERNCFLNNIDKSRFDYLFLNWKTFEQNENFKNLLKNVSLDYIFLSDCLYEDSCLEDIFAMLYYIKSFHKDPEKFSIILTYEERGLMSSISLMCEKWGFKIENIDDYLEFEKLLKKQNFVFDNEIYLFKLK